MNFSNIPIRFSLDISSQGQLQLTIQFKNSYLNSNLHIPINIHFKKQVLPRSPIDQTALIPESVDKTALITKSVGEIAELVLNSTIFSKFCLLCFGLLTILNFLYGSALTEKEGRLVGVTFPLTYSEKKDKQFCGINFHFLNPVFSEESIKNFMLKTGCSVDDAYHTFFYHRLAIGKIISILWVPIRVKYNLFVLRYTYSHLILPNLVDPYVTTIVFFIVIIVSNGVSRIIIIIYQRLLH